MISDPCVQQVIIENCRAVSNAGQGWIPDWLRIAAVLLSGGVVTYLIRLWVGRVKLKRALKTEIRGMTGIKECSKTMSGREKPSSSTGAGIQAKDMPSNESIPTQIYDENIQDLGLLGSGDLECIVEFYTKVKRHKSTISAIRAGEEVPEPDMNDLWEDIEELETQRQELFGKGWIKND